MSAPVIDIVRLGKKGQLALSRRVRSALGLNEGDELIVTVEERRLVVERRPRGFATYLDVMKSDDDRGSEPGGTRTADPSQRRGLGRFLAR